MPPAGRVRGRRGARARARARLRATARCTERAYWRPRYPIGGRRRVPRHRSRTRPSAVRDALERGDRACGCCAPTCRSAATCPAGSTARSSPRSGCARRATGFSTFSLRFEDAEYDETVVSSASMVERLGSEHHEVVVSRRDIAEVVPRRHRPHRAPDPAHRAGAALPALEAGARRRASRSCSPARAPTRCSPATTCSARRKVRRFWARQPASQLAPAAARAALPVPRALAGGAAGDGAAVLRRRTSTAWRQPGFAPRHRAGARPAALKRLFSRRPARRDRRLATSSASCSRRCPPEFARVVAARAGPVPRDPHAAVRLPPLVAGRPDADGALGRGALPVPRPRRRGAGQLAARRRTSCACSTRSTC